MVGSRFRKTRHIRAMQLSLVSKLRIERSVSSFAVDRQDIPEGPDGG